MNRRRLSKNGLNRKQVNKLHRGSLNRKQVNELHRGWERAAWIGRPLNVMLSIRPLGDHDPTAFCQFAARVRNKLGCWARQRALPFVAALARECNQDGTGEHLHVLMQVPAKHYSDLKEKIIDRFLGRAPRMSDLRTSGSSSPRPATGCRRSATSPAAIGCGRHFLGTDILPTSNGEII
jgi:hypothetical protein